MKKLVTAPDLGWFRRWAVRVGENPNDWRFVYSMDQLLEYRNVMLYVVNGVHPDIVRKNPEYRQELKARGILLGYVDE